MFFETKNLCFSYCKKPLCLKDVNITLNKGDKAIFLASSEMGKTTLLKVLSSFESGYYGIIKLNNKDLKSINDKDKNFSILLANPVVFANKTIKQNIKYFCDICDLEMFSDDGCCDFLKKWNINHQINEKMKALYLFEKMKFSIARALLKNPTILFLDDQFDGLSEYEKIEMIKIYKNLLANENLTIVSCVGENTFKILFKNNEIYINRVFYLCDSIIKEYKSLDDFVKKLENLDVFNFVEGFKLVECELIFENNKFKISCNGETAEVLSDKCYKKLIKLNVENFDTYDCVVAFKNNINKDLTEVDLAEMIDKRLAFLYSKMGGEKLI